MNTPPDALLRDVSLQICGLVNELHGLKYVHGDLKPENFVTTKQVP